MHSSGALGIPIKEYVDNFRNLLIVCVDYFPFVQPARQMEGIF